MRPSLQGLKHVHDMYLMTPMKRKKLEKQNWRAHCLHCVCVCVCVQVEFDAASMARELLGQGPPQVRTFLVLWLLRPTTVWLWCPRLLCLIPRPSGTHTYSETLVLSSRSQGAHTFCRCSTATKSAHRLLQ